MARVASKAEFQLVNGQIISCVLGGATVERAIVVKYNSSIYICQNVTNGADIPDRHGYKYSWSVGIGDERGCSGNSVRDIKILVQKMSEISVGDVVVSLHGNDLTVLADIGDVVLLSSEDKDCSGYTGEWYTRKELDKIGFKIKETEPVIEVTVLKDGIPSKEPITKKLAKELGIIA